MSDPDNLPGTICVASGKIASGFVQVLAEDPPAWAMRKNDRLQEICSVVNPVVFSLDQRIWTSPTHTQQLAISGELVKEPGYEGSERHPVFITAHMRVEYPTSTLETLLQLFLRLLNDPRQVTGARAGEHLFTMIDELRTSLPDPSRENPGWSLGP